jgi:hypothetical protein
MDRLEVKQIPSLPEQEAEAERLRLAGAATVMEPQQSTPFAVPIDTDHPHVDVQGGDSHQVPSAPPSDEGASAVSHQHYWIHHVTETIDRGFYGFNSNSFPLAEGKATQILGLDEVRPRADLLCIKIAADTEVYVGDRDVIDGTAPQTSGITFTAAQQSYAYRARKELWAIAVGGAATVGVTAYRSEPTEGSLAKQSASGAGAVS